jgi:hypothetical protein
MPSSYLDRFPLEFLTPLHSFLFVGAASGDKKPNLLFLMAKVLFGRRGLARRTEGKGGRRFGTGAVGEFSDPTARTQL